MNKRILNNQNGSLRLSLPSRDGMTDEEFDTMMSIGYQQALEGDTFDAEEIFDMLEHKLQ